MTISGKSSNIVTGASNGIGSAVSKIGGTRLSGVWTNKKLREGCISLSSSTSDQASKFNTKWNKNLFVPIKCDITKPETFDSILNTIVSESSGNKLFGHSK
jgi:NAD(P)-dependent dehydrogenase (short-subunit alcohol dehydrogenase family)